MADLTKLNIADLVTPAERADQQRQQRAMLRAALGAQYALWAKMRKKAQEK